LGGIKHTFFEGNESGAILEASKEVSLVAKAESKVANIRNA